MSTTYTTTTSHLTYELHTIIFPPSKPSRASSSSIPQYFFPISTSVAHEFLHPAPTSTKSTSAPGPECWPYHLLPHPEWVVAKILRFTDEMRDEGWNVSGMRFVDEEEEERERERVRREMEERRIREEKRGGRVHYYGGVYYGDWYGEGKEAARMEKMRGVAGVSWGYMGGLGGVGGRKRGELKCQILMAREM